MVDPASGRRLPAFMAAAVHGSDRPTGQVTKARGVDKGQIGAVWDSRPSSLGVAARRGRFGWPPTCGLTASHATSVRRLSSSVHGVGMKILPRLSPQALITVALIMTSRGSASKIRTRQPTLETADVSSEPGPANIIRLARRPGSVPRREHCAAITSWARPFGQAG